MVDLTYSNVSYARLDVILRNVMFGSNVRNWLILEQSFALFAFHYVIVTDEPLERIVKYGIQYRIWENLPAGVIYKITFVRKKKT